MVVAKPEEVVEVVGGDIEDVGPQKDKFLDMVEFKGRWVKGKNKRR